MNGTQELAMAIKDCRTPIYGIASFAASAGYWILSACDEVWATSRTAEFGSIGVMMRFVDSQKVYEEEGYVFHEIYATPSKDKNRPFREARNGNYQLMVEEELNPIAEVFQSEMRQNRGLPEEVMTGKTYLAEDAISKGMVDRIGSMEGLVSHIRNKENSVSNQISNSNNMAKGTFKQQLLSAFGFSPKQAEEVTDEQAIEQLQAQVSEMETQAEGNTATISEQAATITSHEATIETQRQRIAELEGANAELTAEVERLGDQPGSTPSKPKKTGQDVKQEKKEEANGFDPNAAHNREANRMLGHE